MTQFPKQDYPIKWVRVRDLSVVWSQAQRTLNERRVKSIMDAFDTDAFGALTTTLPNGHGIHHVIDGQHRAEAIRRMWGDGEMVPCIVLPKTSPQQAADIWLKMNGARAKPGALDSFLVAVYAKRPEESAVYDLLTGMGYRVGLGGEDGTVSAVSTCMAISRKAGIDVLRESLLVIQGTWGRARDSVHQITLGGYAEVVAAHNADLDRKRLVSRVSKKYTAARFIGAARQAREFHGGTVALGAKHVLVTTYNTGLAADKRLDETR